MYKTNKMVLLSLLTAMGVVIGIVENMFPLPTLIPGVKLGIANVVQLIVIVVIGPKESILVAILRSILVGIGSGNVMSILYSLPSSLLSTIVMVIVYKTLSEKFSLVGISVIGALTHNFVQLTVASILVKNSNIFLLYPYMAITSTFTGYFTGILAVHLDKRLKNLYKNR